MSLRPVPRGGARWLAGVLALLGAGCASIPAGPSTLALPGTGRTYEQFRADDALCRREASLQADSAGAKRAAQDGVAAGAIAGAAIGGLAGAAFGGSQGAGVGAGTGLLVGAAAGSSAAGAYGWAAQRRYDDVYVQCMYARGHRVPVFAGAWRSPPPVSSAPVAPSPLPPGVPVPPAGAPPPPPPGVVAPPGGGAAPAPAPRALPVPPPGAPPPPPATWRSG